MRSIHALALIAAAAAVSFSASAAPAASNVDTNMSQVSVSSHSYSKVTEGDRAAVAGAYNLDDGRTLHVSSAGNRLYADLGDTRTEILSIGPNKFASRDDALRVTFDDAAYPSSVLVSTAAGK